MTINAEPQVFVFLSKILRKKIYDLEGTLAGRVEDLVVVLAEPYPYVTEALVSPVRKGYAKPGLFPVVCVDDRQNPLRIDGTRRRDVPAELRDNELRLKEAFMDKQIVDTHGAKVRRVNDLQFLIARSSLHLVHVDVGFRGLMRRVGLERTMDWLLRAFFDYTLPDQFISWKYVQPIASPDLLRLNITQERLSQLHPADLADIIEDLDIRQRSAVFQSLDVETAAETLEETDPKIQVSLIADMDAAEASDIIEEMSLSDAADLLGDLPKEKAEVILQEMEEEIAEDVKELLALPEETAGGLMTTAYLHFPPQVTAGEAMEVLRRQAEEMDFIYYLYVVDEGERLLGMMSLRDILAAPPERPLAKLMDRRVVSVRIDEDKEEVAECFVKYGLMAIPVLDREGRIKGVIQFRDLLELVAPELLK
ncbi:MAG: CBS domain-containing protein [Syntrophales bacterium]|nr:CBS domain-containing protein [Syntrophales bacterium]